MSFQNDLAALINSGLNCFNVSVRVARSDHYGLRGCTCRPGQDGCKSCDESPCQFSSHLVHLHVSSFCLSFGLASRAFPPQSMQTRGANLAARDAETVNRK